MTDGGSGPRIVPTFRLGYTGDYLDENGRVAYGDIGLAELEGHDVSTRFVRELAPAPGDASYWSRLYSLKVEPGHLRGLDGLVVLRPWVTRDTFAEGAGELVVMGRAGAGYDKVDLEACTEHGVAVFNAPHALDHPTASAALLLMLALAKRLPEQQRITRQGRWELQPAVMGGELRGRALGIVGLGHTGRELARLVAPFAMRVRAYSPHADPATARELDVELTTLEAVLAESDFVSLHCRLTAGTRRMIGEAELRRMKPTAYLVNVGRGELVDQAALVEALRDRRIAGAGLDVFETEPIPPHDPLLALENVIATPHWLASTHDVWLAAGRDMARGMLRAARGEVPENVVNPEVLSREEFRRKLGRFSPSSE